VSVGVLPREDRTPKTCWRTTWFVVVSALVVGSQVAPVHVDIGVDVDVGVADSQYNQSVSKQLLASCTAYVVCVAPHT
jgi:hypothetical protein